MDESNIHVLVILAEERIGRRLAEDRAETAEGRFDLAMQEVAKQAEMIESLTNEKRTLMADIGMLNEKLEKAKERQDGN